MAEKFRDINELEKLLGDAYDDRAAKEASVRQALQEMIEFGFTAEGDGISRILDQYGEYLKAIEDITKAVVKLNDAKVGGGSKFEFEKTSYVGDDSKHLGGSKFDAKAAELERREMQREAEEEAAVEKEDRLDQLFSSLSSGLDGFGGEILNLTSQFGVFGLVFAAINEVMSAFYAVVGPILGQVLKPISEALRVLGVILANILIPILEALSPVIQALGEGLVWLFNNVIRHVGNGIITVFNLVYDAIAAVANGFISIYNALVRKSKEKDKIEYRSLDAGWMEEITMDNPVVTGSYESNYGSSYGSVYGGNTTVTRVPDIYLYQTFNGPIIGDGGMEAFGALTIDGIKAYAGAGGDVSVMEVAS